MKATKFIRVFVFVALVVLTYFVCREFLQFIANRGLLKELVYLEPAGNMGANHLIVVVHAYGGSNERMADVRETIRQSRPDAEILMAQYPAGIWSNGDCFKISKELCDKINQRYQEKPGHYESIEFVGYSMGALLARKSFVYACGKTEDIDPDPDVKGETGRGYEWATNGTVKRFVLLAGMNRGWSTRNRPSGMSSLHQLFYTAGKFIGWATGTARLARQCETGEPFVANLRLQWLEVMRTPGMPQPTVIQLLGDTDDIVSSEDSRDANVAKEFIWVQLAGTNHFNATNFTLDWRRKRRKSLVATVS